MADIKNYDKKLLKQFLATMILIRRFESKAGQMYGLRKIGGFCHLYNGQEAVAVGAIGAVELGKDYVLTGYRDHGHALACGMDPKAVMAELYGKVEGCSRGKGGSMHLFDADKHFYGGNGIVGAQIPIATGTAFASMYRQEGAVVLVFFGDGAIHQGAFHESLNMAKIWNLPIVYICENNHFGMGTNYKRVSSVDDFSVMGASYGIPGKQVNGMNVLEVYDAVDAAVKAARKEGTPSLIEALTYRYKGHSMSDPAKYRSKEELESYKEQDPILLLRNELQAAKLVADKDYEDYEAGAKEIVQAAVEFADSGTEPPMESLYEDVLVEEEV